MSGGYITPDKDAIAQLFTALSNITRRLEQLEMPTGTQRSEAVRQLQELVDGLLEPANLTTAGNVTAGGNVTATGTVTGTAGITSPGAATLDVATLPGSRQATWQHISTGRFGYSSSSITRKQNLRPVDFTALDVLKLHARIYEYRAQAAIRDDPNNEHYDPTYTVPDEIGLIAEELIDAGLGIYVFHDDDGTPKGIDYDLFAATALLTVAHHHHDQLTALAARLDAAGL